MDTVGYMYILHMYIFICTYIIIMKEVMNSRGSFRGKGGVGVRSRARNDANTFLIYEIAQNIK